MKPTIFISYSHWDEDWLNYVRSHLSTAEYHGEITTWDDRRMVGGADWEAEISRALSACVVCILLVSRYSLTSDYINRVEMRSALERAKTEGVQIYPIFVSSTYVPPDHWLRKFNWRPMDGRPLKSFPDETDQRDNAMAAIVAEIVKLSGCGDEVTRPTKPNDSKNKYSAYAEDLLAAAKSLTYSNDRDEAYAKIIDIALTEKNPTLAKQVSEFLTYSNERDIQKKKIVNWLTQQNQFNEAIQLANTLTYTNERDQLKQAILTAASRSDKR